MKQIILIVMSLLMLSCQKQFPSVSDGHSHPAIEAKITNLSSAIDDLQYFDEIHWNLIQKINDSLSVYADSISNDFPSLPHKINFWTSKIPSIQEAIIENQKNIEIISAKIDSIISIMETTAPAPDTGNFPSFGIEWNPNTERDLAGYRAHFMTNEGIRVINATKSSPRLDLVGNFANQDNIFVFVTAYDKAGNESTPCLPIEIKRERLPMAITGSIAKLSGRFKIRKPARKKHYFYPDTTNIIRLRKRDE